MECDRRFRDEIAKIVKQRTKLHIGDKVRVREDANSGLHGQVGTLEIISSQTPITDVKKTIVLYLVRIESTNLLYGFSDDELQVLVTPEKVNFT